MGDKIRYCETILQTWRPCDTGWGSIGSDGYKDFCDNPMEENWRNMVNKQDPLICPTCGSVLGLIGEGDG